VTSAEFLCDIFRAIDYSQDDDAGRELEISVITLRLGVATETQKRRKNRYEKSASALSCDLFRIRPDRFGV
jgi:hypothetical protein